MLRIKHNLFEKPLFPLTVIEWSNLDPNLRNENSFHFFKNKILQFIKATLNSFFNCHNLRGIKLVTRLRTGLSHMLEQKFKHSFQNSLSPVWRRNTGIEFCPHFFLYYLLFQNERRILLLYVKSVQIRKHFWSVCSCIWTEYRKVRTRNNSVFGHFSRSAEQCYKYWE